MSVCEEVALRLVVFSLRKQKKNGLQQIWATNRKLKLIYTCGPAHLYSATTFVLLLTTPTFLFFYFYFSLQIFFTIKKSFLEVKQVRICKEKEEKRKMNERKICFCVIVN